MNFDQYFGAALDELKNAGSLRMLRPLRSCDAGRATLAGENVGTSLWNLSGNDYLGIAGDASLREEFYDTFHGNFSTPRGAISAASSRLLTGNHTQYERTEAALAQLYGKGRQALVFNSGYHANIGILPALTHKDDLILSDKLNHASIIDGLRLAAAEFRRYNHGDMAQLARMLKTAREENPERRIFVISESIFSMDGDLVDLRTLCKLKKEFGAFLVLDEAHAVGVMGPQGQGAAAALGVDENVDIIVGTFGKALGSTGAYGIMSPVVRDYLINTMRPFIFTTGLPPIVLAWSEFILHKLPEMGQRRNHVLALGEELRKQFRVRGLQTNGDSQIVPLVIGENQAALQTAERFRQAGILVFAIRPPTVPQHTARLRFSLTGTHPAEVIDAITAVLDAAPLN